MNSFLKNSMYIVLGALCFSGCSFDKSNDLSNRRELEERNDLLERFSIVTGTYEGTLSDDNRVWQVRLSLDVQEEPNGKNSEGETLFRPVLKGFFKRLSPIGPSTLFDARFQAETGNLIIARSAANAADEEIVGINAKVTGENLRGEARSEAGVVGQLLLRRVSREIRAPNLGEDRDYYERLKETYRALSGEFKGYAEPPPAEAPPYAISITLYVTEKENAQRIMVPQLMGYYRRQDGQFSDLVVVLSVTYDSDLTPPRLRMAGTGSGNSAGLSIYIDSRFSNNQITGIQTNQMGQSANIFLQRNP